MADIQLKDKNGIVQTYNGVKAIALKTTDDSVVKFSQNPLVLDTTVAPTSELEGMFVEDSSTHKCYRVTVGSSENFVLFNNFPENFKCMNLYYLNNKFFAVGFGNGWTGYFSSTDGLNWTKVSLSNTSYDNMTKLTMAYLNGTYVFCDRYGDKVYYSTDEITWTVSWQKNHNSDQPGEVISGNGIFLLTYFRYGPFKNYLASSTDGITWTNLKENSNNSYQILGYIPEDEMFYIKVGTTEFYKTTSGNSLISISYKPNDYQSCVAIFKFNGYYYSLGNSTGYGIQKSDLQSEWQVVCETAASGYGHHCFINNKVYVLLSGGDLYKSSDGDTWTFVTNFSANYPSIATNSNFMVALTSGSDKLYYKTDIDGSYYYREIFYK